MAYKAVFCIVNSETKAAQIADDLRSPASAQ